jgi:hypothetical protein
MSYLLKVKYDLKPVVVAAGGAILPIGEDATVALLSWPNLSPVVFESSTDLNSSGVLDLVFLAPLPSTEFINDEPALILFP